MKQRDFLRREGGLTLIELLIVVGIIIAITALTIPDFRGFFSHARLRSDALRVATDLRRYRFVAVSYHLDYKFVFDLNRDLYAIKIYDGSEWKEDIGPYPLHPQGFEPQSRSTLAAVGSEDWDLGDGAPYIFLASDMIYLNDGQGSPIDPPEIVFHPLGNADPSAGAVITLSDDEDEITIRVSGTTGHVSVE